MNSGSTPLFSSALRFVTEECQIVALHEFLRVPQKYVASFLRIEEIDLRTPGYTEFNMACLNDLIVHQCHWVTTMQRWNKLFRTRDNFCELNFL